MCSKMGSQIDTFSKMQEFCWSVGRGGGGKNASSIGFRPGSGPAWTAKLREMRAKYYERGRIHVVETHRATAISSRAGEEDSGGTQ